METISKIYIFGVRYNNWGQGDLVNFLHCRLWTYMSGKRYLSPIIRSRRPNNSVHCILVSQSPRKTQHSHQGSVPDPRLWLGKHRDGQWVIQWWLSHHYSFHSPGKWNLNRDTDLLVKEVTYNGVQSNKSFTCMYLSRKHLHTF